MKEELIEYDDINFVNVKEEVGHVKGWNWGDIRIKEEVVEDDGDDNLVNFLHSHMANRALFLCYNSIYVDYMDNYVPL